MIHAVGPVWGGGGREEPKLLASCYQKSLELAETHTVDSIAFPSISTGAYGYPIGEAARVAQTTVRAWLETHEVPERVVFCCFSDSDRGVYEALARELLA